MNKFTQVSSLLHTDVSMENDHINVTIVVRLTLGFTLISVVAYNTRLHTDVSMEKDHVYVKSMVTFEH